MSSTGRKFSFKARIRSIRRAPDEFTLSASEWEQAEAIAAMTSDEFEWCWIACPHDPPCPDAPGSSDPRDE